MSATDNIGGFRVPDANNAAPVTDSLAPTQEYRSPSPQSNNPYFQHLPNQGQVPDNSYLTPHPESGVSYPSYAPPSYDAVTSSAPSPVPSPMDTKGGLSSHPNMNSGVRSFGDSQPSQPSQPYPPSQPYSPSQPSQMSRSPQPSQLPMSYGVAGPSQPPMQSQSSSSSLSQAGSRDPLDPPPPCFGRVMLPPSESTTYEPLAQPFVIQGKPGKRYLDDAFPTTGLPAFYKHDILAEDWVRFLEDIQLSARLKGGQRIAASVLPVTMHIGFIGSIASRAIQTEMEKNNTGKVTTLLDTWNERFFRPRRLEVILCRGDWRESGNNREAPAPDRPHGHPRQRHTSGSFSSSSDSDSEDGYSNMGRRQMKSQRRMERRQEKHERRMERLARRDTRRSDKRASRKGNEKPFRLVVVSV